MITGIVNPRRQPLVELVVRGPQGQERTVETLVDSGYNGSLALPLPIVAALGLPALRVDRILLGDGRVQHVRSHSGVVVWEGVERPVRVLATGDQPLLGMALLVGYELRIEMVDGGHVVIARL